MNTKLKLPIYENESKKDRKNRLKRESRSRDPLSKEKSKRHSIIRRQREQENPDLKIQTINSKRKYNAKNKDSINLKKRIYDKTFPEKRREKERKARLKEENRIFLNIRARMSKLMSSLKNCGRVGNKINMIGLNKIKLKEYIESMFDNKMTWDNYGEYWVIDHVIPMSLEKGSAHNCIRLNHFSNLRPLGKIENMIKSDTLDSKYITYDLYHRYSDLMPSSFPEPSDVTWEMAVLDPI